MQTGSVTSTKYDNTLEYKKEPKQLGIIIAINISQGKPLTLEKEGTMLPTERWKPTTKMGLDDTCRDDKNHKEIREKETFSTILETEM